MIGATIVDNKATESMDISEISKEDRKKLFIEMTSYVYDLHNIFFKDQVERISVEMPPFNEARMKNLRSKKLKTFPKEAEIKLYFKIFNNELRNFESEIGTFHAYQPTGLENRVTAIEQRMEEFEWYIKERDQLLSEIARLRKQFNKKSE